MITWNKIRNRVSIEIDEKYGDWSEEEEWTENERDILYLCGRIEALELAIESFSETVQRQARLMETCLLEQQFKKRGKK